MYDIENEIKDDILNGVFAPNSRLNISQLKHRYKTSLAPMREALALLAAKGLLIKEKNKGYRVPKISTHEAIELYAVSSHLEALALKQSIEKFDEALENKIISSLYALEKIETGTAEIIYEKWAKANLNFHKSLISNCSNIVKEMLDQIALLTDRYVRIAYSSIVHDLKTFHQEHQEIAKAVLNKNTQLAISLLKSHAEKGMKTFIEGLQGKIQP